jgi:hypothetical protein
MYLFYNEKIIDTKKDQALLDLYVKGILDLYSVWRDRLGIELSNDYPSRSNSFEDWTYFFMTIFLSYKAV